MEILSYFELISEHDHGLTKLLTLQNKYGIIQPTRICLLNLITGDGNDFKSITADLFIVDNKIIEKIFEFNNNDEILEKYANKIIYAVYLQSKYRLFYLQNQEFITDIKEIINLQLNLNEIGR